VDLSARFVGHGGVRFAYATVGGSFEADTSTFSSADSWALNLERTTVEGSVFLSDGFVAETGPDAPGAVRLHGTRVSDQLLLGGCRISAQAGDALWADNVSVGADILADVTAGGTPAPSRVHGPVRLLGAAVGGQMQLSGMRIEDNGSGSISLNAHAATIAQDLFLPNDPPPGIFNLSNASCDALVPGGCLRSTAVLRAFRYSDAVGANEDLPAWLGWLAADPEGFSPTAYRHLAAQLQDSGHPAEAELTMIACERHRWARRPRPLAPVLSWILRATTGYGYRPWRALWCLFLLLLVGTAAVWWLHSGLWGLDAPEPGAFVNKDDVHTPFNPFMYAAGASLSFLPSLQSSWLPMTGLAVAVRFGLTVLGYVLAAAVLAALGSAVKRR
jgi:hypothetical protein